MLRNLLRLSASGKPIYGTPDIGIDAAQIISETSTGDQGPGLLYDDALSNSGKKLRAKVTSWSGTAGTLFVFENGSILVDISQADGSFVIGYDREAWASDGSVVTISDTATVTIGPVNASVGAGEGVGTGSGTGGAATVTIGPVNASVGAGEGVGTGSGTGGAATVTVGAVNATADGGAGTSAGTGSGGSATAGNSASAPGGVGTSIGIGSGGRVRGSNGLATTIFFKSAGIYEQVSAVYVKQAGLYQQAGVFVKQINSWMQL